MIDQFLSRFDVAIRSYLDQHHNLSSIAAYDRRQWLVVVALALLEPLRPAASKIAPAALFLFSAPLQSLPVSVGHALIKGWPTLPTFVFLLVPLPLAIGPFGGVLGPFFLRGLPLSHGPAFDLRRYGRVR
jgi:hypothetical protein